MRNSDEKLRADLKLIVVGGAVVVGGGLSLLLFVLEYPTVSFFLTAFSGIAAAILLFLSRP